jgi:hypothetical protein
MDIEYNSFIWANGLLQQQYILHVYKKIIQFASLAHNIKQDRQCMYDETLRRVCKSLLPWKSNKYKVVKIWPGLFVCKQVTVCPGHIWTTLYYIFVCVLGGGGGREGVTDGVGAPMCNLLIQHAMHMCLILTSFVAPSDYTTFFDIIS